MMRVTFESVDRMRFSPPNIEAENEGALPMIRIENTATPATLAALNKHVHDWHVKAYPGIFRDADEKQLEAYFELSLEKPGYHHFVAHENDQAVGFVQAEIRETEGTPFRFPQTLVFIHIIVVSPGCRNRGVGHLLMERVHELAAQKGISRIELDRWVGNELAGRFFSKAGFRPYRQFMYFEKGQID